MRSVDVLVIGGGVIGASVAWHLAQAGAGRILVIERSSRLGSGSTSLATGGFRVQFSTAVNVRLSLLSREKLLRFREETGVDPGYTQSGYLFLARTESALRALQEAQTVQRSCGVEDVELLTAAEAQERNPAIRDPSIAGGAYGSRDGFIRAMQILRGYSEGATRAGVQFELGTNVMEVIREHGKITRVQTDGGDISASVVVNAAGAWASAIGGVPVSPLRRCAVPTVPTDRLPEQMPMTIWVDDGYHLRMRDGKALLLWPDAPPAGESFDVPQSWIDTVERMTRERVPALDGVALDRSAAWAGLYEVSPDRHAILGKSPFAENLFLANGSSGHGVMHSPAIGQLTSELITGRKPSIDVHPLRATRFEEGQPIVGSHLL